MHVGERKNASWKCHERGELEGKKIRRVAAWKSQKNPRIRVYSFLDTA